jgi:hypothetical protein
MLLSPAAAKAGFGRANCHAFLPPPSSIADSPEQLLGWGEEQVCSERDLPLKKNIFEGSKLVGCSNTLKWPM